MGKTITTTAICTDLKLNLINEGPKEGKTYRGQLTYHNEDHSEFVEQEPKQKQPSPERRYTDLVGALHGKISMNANGVTLHMYVRHDDYKDSCELCDILEQEVEQMTGELSCMDLKQQTEPCDK